jgi:hypothetical protein
MSYLIPDMQNNNPSDKLSDWTFFAYIASKPPFGIMEE